MIELLPVVIITAASIYLFLKAIDCLINTAIFFYTLNTYRLAFDDYEAELFQLETDGNDRDQAAVEDWKSQLAKDLSAYRSLVNGHPWKYRCWKFVSGENRLVRIPDFSENEQVISERD